MTLSFLSFFLMLYLLGCSASDAQKKEEEVAPEVTVKVTRVERRKVVGFVSGVGPIYPLEQATVSSMLSASVKELKVQKGSEVQKGDLIAILENQNLELAKSRAEADLKSTQASFQKVKSGSRPEEIKQAEASVNSARASLNNAQAELDRKTQLFQREAISRKDYEQARVDLETARSNYQTAIQNLQLLKKGSRKEDLEAAWDLVLQKKSELELAQIDLDRSLIRSPLTGVVTEQFVYPGEVVDIKAPIVTIMKLDEVIVRAHFTPEDASQVKAGSEAQVMVKVYPDKVFEGRVIQIGSVLDPTNGTVEIWVQVPNREKELKIGDYATVKVITRVYPDSLVIPKQAALLDEQTSRAMVMVVDKDSIARSREIVRGVINDGFVQILKGLEEGEIVITEGVYGLPDGTKVKPEHLVQGEP